METQTQPGVPVRSSAGHLSTSSPQQLFQAPELPGARPITISQRGAIAKLTCKLFDLVVAIIALLLTGYYGFPWTRLIYMPLAIPSIVWHLAQYITLARHKDRRSVCPGANVCVHLILCLVAILLVVNFCVAVFNPEYRESVPSTQFLIDETFLGCSAAQLILHFVLFTMACIETDRRRRHGTKIVYLVAVPGPADGRMYYNPPAQPPQGIMDSESVPAPQDSRHHQSRNAV